MVLATYRVTIFISNRKVAGKPMKKWLKILVLVGIIAFGFVSNAAATTNYTFVFDLVQVVHDTNLSGQNLGGKDDWYQWIYKVRVVPGGTSHNGLSHFTIGLEDCYKGDLLDIIELSAGANGKGGNPGNLAGLKGNEHRAYTISTGTDGSTGIFGIKWDLTTDDFDTIGDYDYFWFSAPTDQSIDNLAAVKHGTKKVFDEIPTPDCPECHEPAVPEPASMMLFGSGMIGFLVRRRKRA